MILQFRNFSFNDIHVEAAGVIAELAQKHDVDRFIQMSSMNADVDSKSRFLSTKVKNMGCDIETLTAVILCPC